MTRTLAILALSLAGCVGPPDRLILSYQRDPDSGDEKLGAALAFPITYPGHSRLPDPWNPK